MYNKITNPHSSAQDTLILIDTHSLIVRFGFADSENILPRFIRKIKWLCRLFKSNKVLFVMDRCKNNFRKKICQSYKAHRSPLPPYITKAIQQFQDLLEKLEIPLDYHDQYECDDIIATYASHYHQNIIITTDKDLYQLVQDDKTYVFLPFRKQIIDEQAVLDKFKVPPEQIPLYLALVGDASDNIAGVDRVGPVKAAKFIQAGYQVQDLVKRSDHDFKKLEEFFSLTKCCAQTPMRYTFQQIPMLNTQIIENYLFDNNID